MARGEVSAARIISSAVPLLSVLVTVEDKAISECGHFEGSGDV